MKRVMFGRISVTSEEISDSATTRIMSEALRQFFMYTIRSATPSFFGGRGR